MYPSCEKPGREYRECQTTRTCSSRTTSKDQGTARAAIGFDLSGPFECSHTSYDMVGEMLAKDSTS